MSTQAPLLIIYALRSSSSSQMVACYDFPCYNRFRVPCCTTTPCTPPLQCL